MTLKLENYPPILECILKYTTYPDLIKYSYLSSTIKAFSDYVFGIKDSMIHLLRPEQVPHYKGILRWLYQYPCFIDCSVMGSGKTYTTCSIANSLRLDVFVVCPKSVIGVWETVSEIFNVNLIAFTYQGLKSKKNGIEKYLTVYKDEDDEEEDKLKRLKIDITDEFAQLIKRGILVVFDESHYIKNNSMQTKISHSICNYIYNCGSKSRVAFLSATPFDKQQHTKNYLKMMGSYVSRLVIYKPYFDEYAYPGFEELKKMNADLNGGHGKPYLYDVILATEISNSEYMKKYYMRKRSQLLMDFFVALKPHYFFTMHLPKIDAEKDIKNAYYRINKPEEFTLLVNKLHRTAHFHDPSQNVYTNIQINWAMLTKCLVELENAKVNIMVRLARKHLVCSDNEKVILYFNYLSSMGSCYNALIDFDPLYMDGSVSQKARKKIIKDFNTDPNKRLLIANIKVGSLGISLHDTVGYFPRFMYVIPNYSLIDIHQATGRIYRVGARSKATIRFVYVKDARKETRILDALSRKSNILKILLKLQVKEGLLFPSDYKEYVEPDLSKITLKKRIK